MLACQYDMHDLVSYIIDANAKLDLRDGCGFTALMICCRYAKSINSLNILLDAGCDVNTCDNYGQTALMHLLKILPLIKNGMMQCYI